MNGRRLAALALGLLLAAGCQSPPGPAAARPAAPRDPAAEARQALAARDCARAVPLLREALLRAPDDLGLHYGLAVCATHRDAPEEAAREFRWVLERAPAGSPEARTARSWLREAGLLVEARPAAAPGAAAGRGDATLSGRAVWGPPGATPRPQARMLLYLSGLPGTPTQGEYHELRTDDEGRFAFRDVVAGEYKLSDRIAGRPQWRLRVSLEPGRETTLALTPANGLPARDDFPDRGR